MCSDRRRRLQPPSPSSLLLPPTMLSLKEQVALLTQQIQALQNQLSAQTMSPSADPPPPPTTTKLPKIIHVMICSPGDRKALEAGTLGLSHWAGPSVTKSAGGIIVDILAKDSKFP